ncbi:MAG TPA: DUF58 domain-containing protein [Blastocatellia bacterium]|nr:DUF58 domain-containing protein [Blastocatellia bacterium]
MTKESLLDPTFLRKLERLRIQTRRAFPGTMRGERRSTRRGASVEFRDFRKYEAGDDFRHVDWSIFARLERLMLRQFVEEEDVRIDILIDQSRSMHFGEPMTKFDFARRAAAALAFLAVSSLDRVGVATFDSDLRARIRALRGRGHLQSVLAFLEKLSLELPEMRSPDAGPTEDDGQPPRQAALDLPGDSEAVTSLGAVIRRYQRSSVRPGILFVISDFLDAGDFRAEMRLLAQRGFDLNLIQVLAPEELQPQMRGDLMLVDSESGVAREVTVNERVLEAYRSALASYTTSLESFCRAAGIGYTMVAADVSFEDLLLKQLVEGRMAE